MSLVVGREDELSRPDARTGRSSRRKVIVYGMNYAPEKTGVGRYTAEISEYLADQGADVTVVTTPPHYPSWQVEEGWKNGYSIRVENGVRVHRAPLFVRRRIHGIRRLLAPLSFALTSAPLFFWHALRRRPEVIICIEPTLLVAPAAHLAARLTGARTVLHVQDLEVDAAFAVGHLKSVSWMKALAYAFERRMLGGFDGVVTISRRMAERLEEKGVGNDRLAVVLNWVDLSRIFPQRGCGGYRRELGYGEEDFIVLYSGAIGAKQGLDVLLAAAAHLRDEPRLRFVIAGEGPAKAELEARGRFLGNVRFLPLQPQERLNGFLNMADLHVLPQTRGAADLVLPSKLGGMLASGKPLVVTADSGTELARFLKGAAILTPPDDANALAEAIREAMRPHPNDGHNRRVLSRMLAKAEALPRFARFVMGDPNGERLPVHGE
ncbi:MAG: WcaI family glycosyltransferase [Shinella sp.]|nr:WcaI family glycosyltransferase [Shinella sp.]